MDPVDPPTYISIVGPAEAGTRELELAEAAGRLVAERGGIVVTGGLGGVMEAASRGAFEAGGTTLGLLPGGDRVGANEWLTIAVPTGIGELRNGLVVRTGDAIIACGGSLGTLSEVALALRTGRQVISLGGWDIGSLDPALPESALPREAATPEEAVELAFASIPAG
jgi:uncharacterized protein (TIGR00725 family)